MGCAQESLLHTAPRGEDLHFITDDKDFASPLPGSPFDSFLLSEWKTKKQGNLVAYPRLSEFFKAQFPEIKLGPYCRILVASAQPSGNLPNGSFLH